MLPQSVYFTLGINIVLQYIILKITSFLIESGGYFMMVIWVVSDVFASL